MKNIYDDQKIMSPDTMDKIAREYAKQKYSNYSSSIVSKLQNNLYLLEYLNKYQKGTSANLQKCLIKTYSIIKSSVKDLDLNKKPTYINLKTILNNQPKTAHISFNQAKQQVLQNSLGIIKDIIFSYKNNLTEIDFKAINMSLDNICELLN